MDGIAHCLLIISASVIVHGCTAMEDLDTSQGWTRLNAFIHKMKGDEIPSAVDRRLVVGVNGLLQLVATNRPPGGCKAALIAPFEHPAGC